ncbi:MAG: NADH-quinone oxidoreductase subunit J [Verrucomicrobiales bacterium]|nr:NADH-quinone oxidoreductase subunit J [Verrucomicrobiales bacterium]
MDAVSFILGLITLAGAVAAMSLRNLIHCALALILAFGGLAGIFLYLSAQFVGLVQLLVYVGAVGIVFVFAILLTRGGGEEPKPFFSPSWYVGAGTAALLAIVLGAAILGSPSLTDREAHSTKPTVKEVGAKLMKDLVIPMEIMALLLTSALIGATVIAMPEPKGKDTEEAS